MKRKLLILTLMLCLTGCSKQPDEAQVTEVPDNVVHFDIPETETETEVGVSIETEPDSVIKDFMLEPYEVKGTTPIGIHHELNGKVYNLPLQPEDFEADGVTDIYGVDTEEPIVSWDSVFNSDTYAATAEDIVLSKPNVFNSVIYHNFGHTRLVDVLEDNAWRIQLGAYSPMTLTDSLGFYSDYYNDKDAFDMVNNNLGTPDAIYKNTNTTYVAVYNFDSYSVMVTYSINSDVYDTTFIGSTVVSTPALEHYIENKEYGLKTLLWSADN